MKINQEDFETIEFDKNRKNTDRITYENKDKEKELRKDLSLKGASSRKGDIDSFNVRMSGLIDIKGNILSKTLNLKGYSKIFGDVDTEKFDLRGFTKIFGDNYIKDYLEGNGSLSIIKNLKCKSFNFRGALNIDGDIFSDDFKFDILEPSSCKNIFSKNIEIKRDNKKFLNRKRKYRNKKDDINIFKCDYIEANDILLENTHVNKIKGENIKIGRGCIINSIEYSNEVIIDKNSSVGDMNLLSSFSND